jgi:uncharacterized cupredoxin-like copper-binding protein
MLHSRPALALLAVLAIGIAACNAGASPSVAEPTASATSSTAAASSAPAEAATTVNVTVEEYKVTPETDSAPAGDVSFNVTNNGPDDVHEFVVVKTDLAPNALPTKDDGSFDEDGQGVELMGEVEEITVGSSEPLDLSLEAGSYVLLCNRVVTEDGETESHYHEGMHAAFTVE